MNYALIPTLLIAAFLFAIGSGVGRKPGNPKFCLLLAPGILLAIPGIVFALYYFKIFGEPIWLYEFRSAPFSELIASGAGFLAGLLNGKLAPNEKFRRIAGRPFFAGALVIGLIIPYLKPIVLRPRWNEFRNNWSDGVCLQSSESSCGPACVTTLLRLRGQTVTEQEIARACFTSRTGTENWYLARTLRERGLSVQFVLQTNLAEP